MPFSNAEYEARLRGLRVAMHQHRVSATLLTSMQAIAYYSRFLYCAFGRLYGLVVIADSSFTIQAGIDGGQPSRCCYGENITCTDWQRNNSWAAVAYVTGKQAVIGYEAHHLTLAQHDRLHACLKPSNLVDLAPESMTQRIVKSEAEIALIRAAIKDQAREFDIAMAGRDAMELAIAEWFPEAKYPSMCVWFQSVLNTDDAHNPLTARKVQPGDIFSLNTFPMISIYYIALERTLFLSEVDPASLKIWQANLEAYELGMGLLRPGTRCS